MKKRPTDQELALNLFIKQLAVELLDRRLTIIQQPRHRLAQLEAACQRQFPDFNERQIRLKVRGQLKLYRRNLKKAEERLAGCLKSTTPSSSSSSSPTVFSTQQTSGQTSNTCLIVPSSNTMAASGSTLATDSVGRPGPFYTVASEGIHTLLPSSETCSTCNPSVVRLAQTALLNEQRRKGQVCQEILSRTSVSSGDVGGCGAPRSLPAGGPVLLTASSTLANQTPRTLKVLPELRPVSSSAVSSNVCSWVMLDRYLMFDLLE
ncbi:MAC/Perforin domain [Sparganum proliferum]